ncbi:hypothetical protein [Paracidovorax cattleyae]|uniref:RNA polymerase factor sigma-54 n=1 Tax=Paracidovorax cattleyae TaxID=80868 RepID=UPI00336A68AD
MDPEATPEELDAALRTVQSLEPAGVGARNLQECLSLQLPAVVCPLQRALCDAVLARAAEGSGPQAMRQLATRLDVPAHAVREALERLRHLDPPTRDGAMGTSRCSTSCPTSSRTRPAASGPSR